MGSTTSKYLTCLGEQVLVMKIVEPVDSEGFGGKASESPYKCDRSIGGRVSPSEGKPALELDADKLDVSVI